MSDGQDVDPEQLVWDKLIYKGIQSHITRKRLDPLLGAESDVFKRLSAGGRRAGSGRFPLSLSEILGREI